MSQSQKSQRGEGKIGCVLTLLVLASAIAVLIKAFPVYYGNFELVDACDFIATEGSRLPQEQVEANVRDKAKELQIPEALRPGAVKVVKSVTGGNGEGSCTITLRYTRTIDLYGFYKWEVVTDKRISKAIFTSI